MRSRLSSRERMLAAITRESPDYVPFSTYISQGPWFKEPLYWRDQLERAERMLELGLDPTIDIWLPDVVPHPDVAIKTWREKKGHEWSKQLIALALEAGVDAVQYRGWYEIPNYFGRKGWKTYILPIVEEQASMVHAAGKLFSYFLPEGHGVFADMLNDMEADVLQAVDPVLLGAGDLRSLFDACGKTKSFWGGVNANVTINSADRERIFEEVRNSIEILGANGGLILSALLFATLPHQAILWMIESWRKYRTMWS